MVTSYNPGMVYPNGDGWTFNVSVNGKTVEPLNAGGHKTAADAKAAMRLNVFTGRVAHGLVHRVERESVPA